MTENLENAIVEELTGKKHNPFTYGDVLTGEVVHINIPQEYGFITSPDRPRRRFYFRWQDVKSGNIFFDDLSKGTKVRFTEAYHEDKGPRAFNIEVI